MDDLVRELAKDLDDFDSRDEVEQAVQHLVRLGLLYRQGECILPTPAAVYVQGWELG
ncbi:MAG TPA: hypothetical protein VNN15_00970 [Solirubrobacterales bacterium]|nr:hypothetical protein [Solirubrobacterales bacterium]